jgi:hypothetical protein
MNYFSKEHNYKKLTMNSQLEKQYRDSNIVSTLFITGQYNALYFSVNTIEKRMQIIKRYGRREQKIQNW